MKSLLILSLLILSVVTTQARDYFVAPNGSDNNLGSVERPFATIQRAVDFAKPGDRCVIRAGIYCETVDLKGKAGVDKQPIIIMAFNGERVVLDGTVRIDSKWEVDQGNVYKAKISEDVTQLFVDGKLMTLARFPNALAFSEKVWQRNGARCNKSRESNNGHVIGSGIGDRSDC